MSSSSAYSNILLTPASPPVSSAVSRAAPAENSTGKDFHETLQEVRAQDTSKASELSSKKPAAPQKNNAAKKEPEDSAPKPAADTTVAKNNGTSLKSDTESTVKADADSDETIASGSAVETTPIPVNPSAEQTGILNNILSLGQSSLVATTTQNPNAPAVKLDSDTTAIDASVDGVTMDTNISNVDGTVKTTEPSNTPVVTADVVIDGDVDADAKAPTQNPIAANDNILAKENDVTIDATSESKSPINPLGLSSESTADKIGKSEKANINTESDSDSLDTTKNSQVANNQLTVDIPITPTPTTQALSDAQSSQVVAETAALIPGTNSVATAQTTIAANSDSDTVTGEILAPGIASSDKNTVLSDENKQVQIADAETASSASSSSDVKASNNPKTSFEKMLQAVTAAASTTSSEARTASQTITTNEPAPSPTSTEAFTRVADTAVPAARSFVVQTAIPVPLGQPQWSQAVGEKVLWLAAQNVTSAEIHLHPEDLGPMQVKVSVTQDQANITFTSHHPAVREILDQNLNRLRDMFSEQGLNLVNVDVSDKSPQRQQGEGKGQQGQGGSTNIQEEEEQIVSSSAILSPRLVDHYA